MHELSTFVIGNLTKDAQIVNHNGSQFLSFSVAQTPGFSRSNEWVNRDTMWINLTANEKPEKLQLLQSQLRKGVKIVAFADVWVENFNRQKDGTPGTSLKGIVREGSLGVALMHTNQQVQVTPPQGKSDPNVSYSAPQGGSANDPWSSAPQGNQGEPQGDPWGSAPNQDASNDPWGDAPF